MTKASHCSLAGVLLAVISGCTAHPPATVTAPPRGPAQASLSEPIRFESAAASAGIHFTLSNNLSNNSSNNGHSPLTILQTSGGGCAFLDYDNDGWADILLVGPFNLALYHNERNGTFRDVTATSGLRKDRHWMGCTVGDYDGDGKPDIFLTGYHCCALYHNLGGGRFEDVTRAAGISGLDWSLSAAFADLTGNGRLDLFVSQYVHFDANTPQDCLVGRVRATCGPELYSPLSGRLFINLDGKHFRAAHWSDTGKTWGVLASDLLDTGRPQLYLANDQMPGDLWDQRSGAWHNVGPASGTAYDGHGQVQGGMGVDSGDYDNDGKLDLLVTTFVGQSASLYHNDGSGLFTESSGPTLLGPATLPYVKFGAGFADFDNDGWLDVMITCGQVRDNINLIDASQTYKQPIQLFRNNHGRFSDVSSESGIAGMRAVGRGMAFADYDHDGKMDALICNLEGDAILLHNITQNTNHWLNVRLADAGGNRNGLGARLTLTANGLTRISEIRTCGSVLSAHEPIAHFGLGEYSGPAELTVRWPDRGIQHIHVNDADRTVTVRKSRN